MKNKLAMLRSLIIAALALYGVWLLLGWVIEYSAHLSYEWWYQDHVIDTINKERSKW